MWIPKGAVLFRGQRLCETWHLLEETAKKCCNVKLFWLTFYVNMNKSTDFQILKISVTWKMMDKSVKQFCPSTRIIRRLNFWETRKIFCRSNNQKALLQSKK